MPDYKSFYFTLRESHTAQWDLLPVVVLKWTITNSLLVIPIWITFPLFQLWDNIMVHFEVAGRFILWTNWTKSCFVSPLSLIKFPWTDSATIEFSTWSFNFQIVCKSHMVMFGTTCLTQNCKSFIHMWINFDAHDHYDTFGKNLPQWFMKTKVSEVQMVRSWSVARTSMQLY